MKYLLLKKKFIFLVMGVSLLYTMSQFNLQSKILPTTIPTAPVEDINPLISKGKAKTIPWSGWWWPFSPKKPPNLYNPNGPMDKYDKVSTARGKSSAVMNWEKENHYTDKSGEGWFGHCNGWAAAAILEPEPKQRNVISGVYFEINDIMGLLSEWHWWDGTSAFYGTRYEDENDDINDVYPHEFHHAVISFIGERGLPLVMDISGGTSEKNKPQVWNFPAFQYEFKYRADSDDAEKTHVHCRIWFSDFTKPTSLGTKTFTKDYYYWIKGDKHKPVSGEWESSSVKKHPDFLWYPVKAKAHPVLDAKQFSEIVGNGENR